MSFFYSAASFCEKTIGFIKSFCFNIFKYCDLILPFMVDGPLSTTREMLASLSWGSELLSDCSLLVSSLKAPSSNYPVKYT